MKEEKIKIANIPAVIYGEKSNKVFLFIHGKSGYKEEANLFAKIACKYGWQVLGVDLPGHGQRKAEIDKFYPWFIIEEFKLVYKYMESKWKDFSVRANSIGAMFVMLSCKGDMFKNALFVSPLLDMKQLIENMMYFAKVSENELQDKGEIETNFGETLSWEYYQYARQNPISNWKCKTSVLYAGKDNLTSRDTVNDFINKFNANLTVMEDGEHWFHTCEQLKVLAEWEENCLKNL